MTSVDEQPVRRPPGRPVSERSRAAVLAAATEMLAAGGFAGLTIDGVARRSRVSKATIYRHWDGALALAVEAWGSRVTAAVPVRDSGDAVADLRGLIVRLAAFYASPDGRVAAEVLAAAVGHPDGPRTVSAHFFGARRGATVAVIERGVAAGQLRAGLDPELAIDLLFGPIVFRLFNGSTPLGRAGARRLADMALPAIAAG